METFSASLALSEGKSTDHRQIPLTKASDAEFWCFLWSVPLQTLEQTIETPVIWDAAALIMTPSSRASYWIPYLLCRILKKPDRGIAQNMSSKLKV